MWSDVIDGVSVQLLKKYFKADSPLGPLTARVIADRPVLELLTEHEIRPEKANSQRPSIVVGRKGSGKTSYLRRLGLGRDPSIFIELKTEKGLNLILAVLDKVVHESVSVESIASIWDGVFWNCLLWMMNRAGRPIIGHLPTRTHLRTLGIADCDTIEVVIGALSQRFEQIAKDSGLFAIDKVDRYLRGSHFDHLKEYVNSDLERNNQTALLVLDSLDDYPINVEIYKKTLGGLLKCAGEFNAVEARFDLRLCLPSELYIAFTDDISTNAIKDFSNQFILRWPVDELLLAACRRLMIFLRLYCPSAYTAHRQNELLTRRDANSLLDGLFPTFTKNLNGRNERTTLYLLRHTQLMPRQLLIILGSILQLSNISGKEYDGKPIFDENHIREGIKDTEGLIVQEIFTAYRQRYPLAKEVCHAVIPTLQKVFTSDQLTQAVKYFSAERSATRASLVRRLLIEIGAIGKVTTSDSIYTEGRFEYSMPGQLPTGAQDKLCIHPLFSRVCESRSSVHDQPILPFSMT
jgi:hypothetical protein